MSLTKTSKYIAYILRHCPQSAGVTLDAHGWADVKQLIEGVSKTHPLTMAQLEQIVTEDGKQRYAFSEDRTKIRANQGHSVAVDVELTEAVPPEILWHGTAERFTASIDAEGLLPRGRLHVHLSALRETAIAVGSRHGKPALYQVDTQAMLRDGLRFFRSENGVWLTAHVPARYLRRIREEA